MSERKVYHVVKEKGTWKVKGEGNKNASATADTQEGASDIARSLAKKAPLGQVKVHRPDGRIRTEWTYGKDPSNVPG